MDSKKGSSNSLGSIGAGFGMSKGSGKYKQTQLSSIVGSESVTMNIGGKLSLTGSMIANAELVKETIEVPVQQDGKASFKSIGNSTETQEISYWVDKGNLNITAGSFESTDLTDYNENHQKGFNFGTSGGIGQNEKKDGGGKFLNGTTTIGLTNTGYESEGVTRATIGAGNITIKDGTSLAELNRDINNVSETTKDLVTGALNGSFSIDNRMLTPNTNGWRNIGRQFAG